MPQITTLDSLIAELREIFKSDEIDTDYVQKLMESYVSNKEEWQKFAHFDPNW